MIIGAGRYLAVRLGVALAGGDADDDEVEMAVDCDELVGGFEEDHQSHLDSPHFKSLPPQLADHAADT